MLRDLCTVIEDLHQAMLVSVQRAGPGVRIAQAEMTLPVDAALVLQNEGCTLLADVARNHADAAWMSTPSRLSLVWGEFQTADLMVEGHRT